MRGFYHIPVIRVARSIARKCGVVRILTAVRRKKIGYEDTFANGLKAAIKRGDVVWDIGANVGYYTTQFLDWTGTGGNVVAFEPLEAALNKLNAALSSGEANDNIIVCPVALANKEGEAAFEGHSDSREVLTTGHLSDREANSAEPKTKRVKVMTADGAMAAWNLPLPTVTKIDVEGYEEDVLNGGSKTFSSPQSKHIFIEIHFDRLEQRGKAEAPASIVRLLKSWGYKVCWLDASHLHGFRGK